MQYKNPANRELVLEGLKLAGRMDLVGYDKKCLIRPIREKASGTGGKAGNQQEKRGNKKTIRNVHKRKEKGVR